jgi:thiamine-phosphate diphosphorylase
VTARAAGVLPPLHVVTDDRILAADDWVTRARAVLDAGADGLMLHVRGPGTSGRRLFDLARMLAPGAAASGAVLTVNDRADVALAAGLRAVHLGARSLTPSDARGLLGAEARIGLSCHAPADLAGARTGRVDYAFAGNVFRTSSHPELEAKGTAWLGRMVAEAGKIPVFAIGGVTPDAVAPLISAGAAGVAVMGGVWGSPDPAAAAAHYIATITRAFEEAHGGD